MSDRDSAASLRALIDGHRGTALLYVAARLGLADLLAAGPREPESMAQELNLNVPALCRILHGLVGLGVVRAETNDRFSLGELGRHLCREAPGLLREWALVTGEEYAPAWGALLHSVKTGEAAFDAVFGMSIWEHRRQNPDLARSFDRWLHEQTLAAAESILRVYDFSTIGEIVDLGGGRGALLGAILEAHPQARGLLFELPQVVAGFRSPNDRLRVQAGDLFAAVPKGGDLYLLKSVLHDWDDLHAQGILENCRAAMSRSSSLLVIERLLPARAADNPATVMLDLHMLAVLGGRERTEAEYRALGRAANLTLRQTLASDSGFALMEFAADERGSPSSAC